MISALLHSAHARFVVGNTLLLALVVCSIACTTIRGVGGGSRPGEFYVVTNEDYGFFQSPPEVLRCQSDPQKPTRCERVLTSEQLNDPAGSASIAAPEPAPEDRKCWESGNAAAGWGRERHPDAAMVAMHIAADQEDDCRAAYEAGYKAGAQ